MMRSSRQTKKALIRAMLVAAIAGLHSVARAHEPAPLPSIPRVSTTDPLTRGFAISDVKRIRVAGIATVIDAAYCVDSDSGYSRTRYTLDVSDAWCGSTGELQLVSHWSICPFEDKPYGQVTDTGLDDLMHFLCVGDEIAFLAADVPNAPASDGLVMHGAVLADGDGFVSLGHHSIWKVVDAAKSGDVTSIDEAILVAREVRWQDKVGRSILRDNVHRALEEADHECVTP